MFNAYLNLHGRTIIYQRYTRRCDVRAQGRRLYKNILFPRVANKSVGRLDHENVTIFAWGVKRCIKLLYYNTRIAIKKKKKYNGMQMYTNPVLCRRCESKLLFYSEIRYRLNYVKYIL